MEKEYVVTFPVSYQISEDNWNVKTMAMKVTESTTVGEIELFFRKFHKQAEQITEIKLSELQTP